MTVHELALGAKDGAGVLRVPVLNGVLQHRGGSLLGPRDQTPTKDHPVQIRTLDSFSVRNLKVIKIDVEGTELAVLQGARSSIARERPILIVELLTVSYEDPAGAVASICRDFGYVPKIVADGALVDAQAHLVSGATCESRNVVFLPVGAASDI